MPDTTTIIASCAGDTPMSPLNYVLNLDALRGKRSERPLKVELTRPELRKLKTILDGWDL